MPIELDTITLAASVSILLLNIIAAFLTPFFRFRKREDTVPEAADEPSPQLPALSVVLTPFDDIDGIRQHLPALLAQDYPSPFQIIIVLEQGDHDGEAVIAWIAQEHQREHPQSKASVYVTCIPRSSRYVSRKKLAITLGVKAAETEWVALTESYCRPASDQWLRLMARHCNGENHLVVGYGNYSDDAPGAWRFEKLYRSYYLMREIAKGTAYRDLAHNIAFRKDDFMRHDGFQGNLEQMRGEYDFMVNKYASMGNTHLVTDDGAWMIEEGATPKRHLTDQLFYLETRKHLERSLKHRMLYNLDQSALHLAFCVDLLGIAWGAISQNIILLATSVLALLFFSVTRMLLTKRALRSFGESIFVVSALLHELGLVWRSLRYLLRYRCADRLDFTTHKL